MTIFKPGDKIKPVRDGGASCWYPYITVIGKGFSGFLHVKFSERIKENE